MYLKELEEYGFTQREIRVYLTLLELGESSAAAIIKKSAIPGSKIYETIEKLKEKGVVTSIFKQGRSFFRAASPKIILQHFDEQRHRLDEEVIPKLEMLHQAKNKQRETTLYEGIKGLKTIYPLMLRKLQRGDTIYALGAPAQALQKMGPTISHFNKERMNKGIKLKILYKHDAREHGEQRKKMRLSSVRYMKKGVVNPTWVDIFGEHIVLFDIENKSAVLIKNESMAQGFKAYFEEIWKNSK
jgi:HTH-type transcriptional regulator, sugar sensing transcriptional regulator